MVGVEPVAKLGDAYLLEPDAPLELNPTPFEQGQAPAVRTAEGTLEAEKRHACFLLWNQLLNVRWEHPQHPSLNPYRAARLLCEGPEEFRRDVQNDLAALRGINPGFISQVSADRTAHALWHILRQRVREWGLRVMGREMTPKQVCAAFEKYWQPPPPRIDPEKAVWELEEHGKNAGLIDEFKGATLKREGTIHEIISDIADPVRRDYEHAIADEAIESVRKAQMDGETRSF